MIKVSLIWSRNRRVPRRRPCGGLDATTVTLDLGTSPLNGIADNDLDTLHTDYAFIIGPGPVAKNRTVHVDTTEVNTGWDFALYPNPAYEEVKLILPNDDVPKAIVMYDMTGKQVHSINSQGIPNQRIPLAGLAKGAYCLRVSDHSRSRIKTLIIH